MRERGNYVIANNEGGHMFSKYLHLDDLMMKVGMGEPIHVAEELL